MSDRRTTSIPLVEEERSVESSSMGDDTREFLVPDEPPQLVDNTESSSLNNLQTTLVSISVPIFKTFNQDSVQEGTEEDQEVDGDLKEDYGETYVEKVKQVKSISKVDRVEDSATTLPWNISEGRRIDEPRTLKVTDLLSAGSTQYGEGSQSKTSTEREIKKGTLPSVKEEQPPGEVYDFHFSRNDKRPD